MRKLLPLLALLLPACGDADSTPKVEYSCACGKTKSAPAGQAPS